MNCFVERTDIVDLTNTHVDKIMIFHNMFDNVPSRGQAQYRCQQLTLNVDMLVKFVDGKILPVHRLTQSVQRCSSCVDTPTTPFFICYAKKCHLLQQAAVPCVQLVLLLLLLLMLGSASACFLGEALEEDCCHASIQERHKAPYQYTRVWDVASVSTSSAKRWEREGEGRDSDEHRQVDVLRLLQPATAITARLRVNASEGARESGDPKHVGLFDL